MSYGTMLQRLEKEEAREEWGASESQGASIRRVVPETPRWDRSRPASREPPGAAG